MEGICNHLSCFLYFEIHVFLVLAWSFDSDQFCLFPFSLSCAEKWPVNYNLVILLLIILVVPTSDLSWIFIKKQKYFHLCLDDQPLGPANI